MTQGKLFSTSGRTPGTVPMFRMMVRADEPNRVYVQCTRCGNKFEIPNRKAWANSMPQDTRSCPFCYKVSYIRKQRA